MGAGMRLRVYLRIVFILKLCLRSKHSCCAMSWLGTVALECTIGWYKTAFFLRKWRVRTHILLSRFLFY